MIVMRFSLSLGTPNASTRARGDARIDVLIGPGALNMNSQLLQQASELDVDEQIELVEAIWDGIVSRGGAPSMTDMQKAELDRRLAEHHSNPDDVVPWSEVKATALSKIGR
jgi:putative addiction module component (TIGR02574 family)